MPILSTAPEGRRESGGSRGYSGRMEHTRDEPTDALWSRLRLIEGQPLADRADAYATLHDELMKHLEHTPRAGDAAPPR